MTGPRSTRGTVFHLYHTSRFYSTYTRFNNFGSWRWTNINNSVLFNNFSSKSQFRLKQFHRFYKTPTLTQLLRRNLDSPEETRQILLYRPLASVAGPAAKSILTSLRLNLLLTKKFHDVIMDLARPASTMASGCYVDFHVEPKLLIPASTILNGEVLQELLDGLKRFERHLHLLQKDLANLSELGELPLKFVPCENVIRVFFPNCDREKLHTLLVEKNVRGGIIYEDLTNECGQLEHDSSVTSISDFDILSSCTTSSRDTLALSVSLDYDADILSESAESLFKEHRVVHLEPVDVSAHVEIADEFYWA